MWKFNWQKDRDKWLVLLSIGVIVCILAFPAGRRTEEGEEAGGSGETGQELWPQESGNGTQELEKGLPSDPAGLEEEAAYERQLEKRLEDLLSQVEGVGEADVMIVLESSEERVWRVDQAYSSSVTKETDSSGGIRDIQTSEKEESTILSGQGGEQGPLLEKELRPVVSGVVVSAQGGGNPTVRAEISAAVEALLSVPAHKIKVLQRKR